MTRVVELTHNRIRLALHHLREGDGRPLLVLHGLGERSPTTVPAWADAWDGPVAALDFTGHGASTIPRGGGYTSEILLADADIALASLGSATVVGRGLGAYIALQLAGARPRDVIGAVLCDGPGLAGGPTEPTSQSYVSLDGHGGVPDAYALVELGRDLRPPDYATWFVRLALEGSQLDEPITVAAIYRPAWLEAVAAEHGVASATVPAALAAYAGVR
jgi:pimeloyl-ACP methyl ester carboxylesterase